jgi:hypothetical protein
VVALRKKLKERLQRLRHGTTMCPGRLARDCGTTLREARGEILALAKAGRITVSQRGRDLAPESEIKGPFRVRWRGGRRHPGGGAR